MNAYDTLRDILSKKGRFTQQKLVVNTDVFFFNHIPDDPCMEYLPTKLGHNWGKCRDSYSSTMVRIWDMKSIEIR